MKTWMVTSSGLTLMGTLVCLAACSGEAKDEASSRDLAQPLSLRLSGEGATLRLNDAPDNPGYAPEYPNPKRLTTMTVGVERSGELVARCTVSGKPVTCLETPFVTEVVPVRDGVDVLVLDVYGTMCGKQHFPDDGSGGAKELRDAGPATADASTSADGGVCSCGESGNTGACSEAEALATRNAYCGEINDWLKQHRLPKIDCSTLDLPGYDNRPNAPKGTPDIACEDIWGAPYLKIVMRWTKTCASEATRTVHWNNVVRWLLIKEGACAHSPLVLDLDGDGIHLGTPESGVAFDLLGGGRKVTAAWPEGGDAFLALDRDGNGQIDGASELFGQSTDGRMHSDGFAALSELDDNRDGVVDARDVAFKELVVWRDRNRDGIGTKDELALVGESGVRRLETVPVRIVGEAMFDANGNRIPLVGSFERADGTKARLVDAYLRYLPLPGER